MLPRNYFNTFSRQLLKQSSVTVAMEAPSKPMHRLDSVAVHKKNLEKKKNDPKPHAANQHAPNGNSKGVATKEEKSPKEKKQVPIASDQPVANEKIEKSTKKQKHDKNIDKKSDGSADKPKGELFPISVVNGKD